MPYAFWPSMLLCLLLHFGSGCVQPAPPPAPSETRAQPRAPSLDLSEIERWVHLFVNQTRQARRLPLLEGNDKLALVARHHSQDMAEHDYFDHVNLRGERPDQRAKQEGISCALGENLYQTYQYDSYQTIYSRGQVTVRYDWKDEHRLASDTVAGWLDSPSHRAILLSPNYTVQGIGVALSPGLKVFVTQNLC